MGMQPIPMARCGLAAAIGLTRASRLILLTIQFESPNVRRVRKAYRVTITTVREITVHCPQAQSKRHLLLWIAERSSGRANQLRRLEHTTLLRRQTIWGWSRMLTGRR